MTKIGFIGYGNMGAMIINNILELNLLDTEYNNNNITVSNKTISKLGKIKKRYPKITITNDNIELAKNSEKIFIFVKTPQFKGVLDEILPFLNENAHIIHICAGLSFENIGNIWNGKVSLVIPSINSKIKGGISLISHNSNVNDLEKEFIDDLFNKFSNVKEIKSSSENNDLEIATVITSCFPAFLALSVKEILKASNSQLHPKTTLTELKLRKMLLETIIASSKLLFETNTTEDQLISEVATPNGITDIGLKIIERDFDVLVNKVFEEVLKKYDSAKNSLYIEYEK